MKLPIALTSILVALLLAACASKSDKPQRFELRGFSVTTPAVVEGDRPWSVVKQTPDLLVLGQPGDYESEIFIVQAAVIRLPALASPDALMQHVKATQQRDLDPKRFRILKHELSLQQVDAESCALSLGLAHGVKLLKPVAAGQPLRWTDVSVDESSYAVKARREMERLFASHTEVTLMQ